MNFWWQLSDSLHFVPSCRIRGRRGAACSCTRSLLQKKPAAGFTLPSRCGETLRCIIPPLDEAQVRMHVSLLLCLLFLFVDGLPLKECLYRDQASLNAVGDLKSDVFPLPGTVTFFWKWKQFYGKQHFWKLNESDTKYNLRTPVKLNNTPWTLREWMNYSAEKRKDVNRWLRAFKPIVSL